jgi:hypothetical protein
MMTAMITLVLTGLVRGVRTQRALVLENLALRHQLTVLRRSTPRPRLRPSDRLFWVLLSRLWHGWAEAVAIVQPETVIRWHRTGFKLLWTWKSRQRGPGRPAVAPELRALIRRMAEANPLWGAPRIHGVPAIIDQAGRPFNVAETDAISRRHNADRRAGDVERKDVRSGSRATQQLPERRDGGALPSNRGAKGQRTDGCR